VLLYRPRGYGLGVIALVFRQNSAFYSWIAAADPSDFFRVRLYQEGYCDLVFLPERKNHFEAYPPQKVPRPGRPQPGVMGYVRDANVTNGLCEADPLNGVTALFGIGWPSTR
jgi:hypothetical protein